MVVGKLFLLAALMVATKPMLCSELILHWGNTAKPWQPGGWWEMADGSGF